MRGSYSVIAAVERCPQERMEAEWHSQRSRMMTGLWQSEVLFRSNRVRAERFENHCGLYRIPASSFAFAYARSARADVFAGHQLPWSARYPRERAPRSTEAKRS